MTEQKLPHERRATARKQLCVKGIFKLPNGRSVAVRTVDASTMGVGIEHEEPLPIGAQGVLALALLDINGAPTVVQATTVVRHSHMKSGGWATGAAFAIISEKDKAVLERVLRNRLALVD
jgi:hypothetical protein